MTLPTREQMLATDLPFVQERRSSDGHKVIYRHETDDLDDEEIRASYEACNRVWPCPTCGSAEECLADCRLNPWNPANK